MFKRVLVANRGEIAIRISKTLRRLGIESVAIYSWPEKKSWHVKHFDKAYELPGDEPVAAYLNSANIINIAKDSGCEAIHPGYGFLSENPEFALACKKNNLVFIGPTADCMQALGNKVAAKKLAKDSNVPVAASLTLSKTLSEQIQQVTSFAKEHKYPFLIKAAAGGGGRGMRIIRQESGLSQLLEQAAREAQNSFSNAQIFCEQLIEKARHIEVQFLVDQHENVFIFYDRDCSAQRNHQKVIEEAPSPNLPDQVRTKLYDYTTSLAKASKYFNAGTAEFLVDQNHNIFFLEVNSRLQVEHPVSEMISGYDLVELQLRVAAGENLSNKVQLASMPATNLHAIELRLCAELPQKNYMPTTGIVQNFVEPQLSFIRLDSSITSGSKVSSFFDSLLAKIITVGQNRNECIEQLLHAIQLINPTGVENNSSFLRFILNSDEFRNAHLHTSFLAELGFENQYIQLAAQAAALCCFADLMRDVSNTNQETLFRLNGQRKISRYYFHQGLSFHCILEKVSPNRYKITNTKDSIASEYIFKQALTDRILYQDNEQPLITKTISLNETTTALWLACELGSFCFQRSDPAAAYKANSSSLAPILLADLPGKILSLPFKIGDSVTASSAVVTMESMKMEHSLYAPANAIIKRIEVKVGQQIESRDVLLEFDFIKD